MAVPASLNCSEASCPKAPYSDSAADGSDVSDWRSPPSVVEHAATNTMNAATMAIDRRAM